MGFIRKYLVYILGAVAIAAIAYGSGNLHGYKSGYSAGEESNNGRIKDLENQLTLRDEEYNRKTKEANSRIDELVKASQEQTGLISLLRESLSKKQTQIVTEYQTKYVQSASSCGLDAPTVSTINNLLNAAKGAKQ